MSDRQLRFIMRGLTELAERVVSKVSLDITANLVEATPVDTGWARANWVPSIGSPFKEITGNDDNVSDVEQQKGVTEVATNYSLERGPVFISNNVPYITHLNDGSSTQAPAGFVQVAIHKAVTQDIGSL